MWAQEYEEGAGDGGDEEGDEDGDGDAGGEPYVGEGDEDDEQEEEEGRTAARSLWGLMEVPTAAVRSSHNISGGSQTIYINLVLLWATQPVQGLNFSCSSTVVQMVTAVW